MIYKHWQGGSFAIAARNGMAPKPLPEAPRNRMNTQSMAQTSTMQRPGGVVVPQRPPTSTPPQRPSAPAPFVSGRGIQEVIKTVFADVKFNAEKPLSEQQQVHAKVQITEDAKQFARLDGNQAHKMEIHGKTYMLSQGLPGGKPSELPAIWKKTHHIRQGGMKEVYGGKYIGQTGFGRQDVLKESRTNRPEFSAEDNKWFKEGAKRDLAAEFRIANDVHKNGIVPGVALPPHSISYGDTVSYLEPQQKMDGSDVGYALATGGKELSSVEQSILNDPGQIHDIVTTVVSGLDHLHNQENLYHGDGKSGNLLWDGSRLLVADLGGARKFDELVSLDRFPELLDILGTNTQHYVSQNCTDKINALLEKYVDDYILADDGEQKQIIKNMLTELKPVLMENDNFSHGTALYESIMGQSPSYLIPGEYSQVDNSHVNDMKRAMDDLGIFPETSLIICQMILPSYEPL